MTKHYSSTFINLIFLALTFGGSFEVASQEPKIFTIADFDLRGKVKTCLVITDYGKEEFEFNELGYLTKSVTRYNENDYDVTYYKYRDSGLAERRDEKYRDGVFDQSTSIAHFFTTDTVPAKKITEKIFSYNREALDQYEYHYKNDSTLEKIVRSNDQGLDETLLEYSTYKDETTVSYILNGELQKSIRTSTKKKKNGTSEKIVLTKEYLKGEPLKAMEQTYNIREQLISEQRFAYDVKEKSFAPDQLLLYSYEDESGMLKSVTTKTRSSEGVREYIYQFDGSEYGNWIKQIITPENEYTTRKIEYYQPEAEKVEE